MEKLKVFMTNSTETAINKETYKFGNATVIVSDEYIPKTIE